MYVIHTDMCGLKTQVLPLELSEIPLPQYFQLYTTM